MINLTALSHCADMTKHIKFNTEIISAVYCESLNRWKITDSKNITYEAKFCIMATGCLSKINQPKFKNLSSFKGSIYHTGEWPHKKVDLKNKNVGIIGTGSSAIQTIPEIIKDVKIKICNNSSCCKASSKTVSIALISAFLLHRIAWRKIYVRHCSKHIFLYGLYVYF